MLALPNRTLIVLEGADTLGLLERTVTHTISDWAEGKWRLGALLTPQGKIIADYLAERTPDGVRLDVHADAAENLMRRLKLLKLRAAVDIRLCTERMAATCETAPADPRHPDLPHRWTIPAENAGLAPPMPARQWNRLRIATGVPEWGSDYRAEDVFPTDVNMDIMNGIDYRKGCFIGQEVASRMKRKGGIRKRTVHVSGPGVEKGAELVAPNSIGTVTSAEGEDGLALIRVDRFAKTTEPVLCGGEPVSVDIPDWLEREIHALKKDGHEPL